MTEDVNWGDIGSDNATSFDGNTMPKPGRSRTSAGAGGRTRRVSDKRLSALQEKLSAEMFQAGAMIGLGVPVTGYYICNESDNFTSAVVTLAARKTEWVAALENLASLGPGIVVGRTCLGIGASLAADRYYRTDGESGLDPERRAAMFLGVTSAYYAVHPPEGGFSAEQDTGYAPPPHAAYAPVS
jgi:hypothetical protein